MALHFLSFRALGSSSGSPCPRLPPAPRGNPRDGKAGGRPLAIQRNRQFPLIIQMQSDDEGDDQNRAAFEDPMSKVGGGWPVRKGGGGRLQGQREGGAPEGGLSCCGHPCCMPSGLRALRP